VADPRKSLHLLPCGLAWNRLATIRVKSNSHVQQILAKFHPDQLTLGRMAAEKPVFWV